MQHFIYHLTPRGTGAFVLADGSMSSNQAAEGNIRKAIIEAGQADCLVALPEYLSSFLKPPPARSSRCIA